jgi:hypothetical protein
MVTVAVAGQRVAGWSWPGGVTKFWQWPVPASWMMRWSAVAVFMGVLLQTAGRRCGMAKGPAFTGGTAELQWFVCNQSAWVHVGAADVFVQAGVTFAQGTADPLFLAGGRFFTAALLGN